MPVDDLIDLVVEFLMDFLSEHVRLRTFVIIMAVFIAALLTCMIYGSLRK